MWIIIIITNPILSLWTYKTRLTELKFSTNRSWALERIHFTSDRVVGMAVGQSEKVTMDGERKKCSHSHSSVHQPLYQLALYQYRSTFELPDGTLYPDQLFPDVASYFVEPAYLHLAWPVFIWPGKYLKAWKCSTWNEHKTIKQDAFNKVVWIGLI